MSFCLDHVDNEPGFLSIPKRSLRALPGYPFFEARSAPRIGTDASSNNTVEFSLESARLSLEIDRGVFLGTPVSELDAADSATRAIDELSAANDKLSIYRRSQPPHISREESRTDDGFPRVDFGIYSITPVRTMASEW